MALTTSPVPARAAATRRVTLASGTLELGVERTEIPVDELCGFACRRSRRRGFVFVSKVLGKHYPVRPRTMRAVHGILAKKLHGLPGPVAVVGLSETATGLGHGVFERWIEDEGRDDALFMHTTRYRLDRPLAFSFQEEHSHATVHWLHRPRRDEDHALCARARTLVLVDDEISTGKTLANLARAFRESAPSLERVVLVSLTDWLDAARRAELARVVGLPVTCESLLSGSFTFHDDPRFDPGIIPQVVGDGATKDRWLPHDHGRLGVRAPLPLGVDVEALLAAATIERGARVLVLGTGEFMHMPFRLALALEERGLDVMYQSTTRSPLLVGHDLASCLELVDNYHDGIPNYLYNVVDRRYDRILVGYETSPLPDAHRLLAQLGAHPVYFAR